MLFRKSPKKSKQAVQIRFRQSAEFLCDEFTLAQFCTLSPSYAQTRGVL